MQDQELEMGDIAEKLYELREQKRNLESQLKELNNKVDETEWQLIEIMTTKEMNMFKHKGIGFILNKKEFKRANKERRDELYQEFKNRGMEDLFTINANTLSGKINELRENNDGVMPEWLDGLIDISEKQYISIRKN